MTYIIEKMKLAALIGFSVVTLGACAPGSDTAGASSSASSSADLSIGMTNPGVVEINDASVFSQVVAISDVHGMFDPTLTLLRAGKIIDADNNWIAGKTLLVVDGDSVDKGPKSLEVLNLWIQLQSQSAAAGGGLIHVLGNHEAEFLADPANSKAVEFMGEMAAQKVAITDFTGTQTPRGAFLHNEPVAARVGKWLFTHSGFYPNLSWADFKTQAKQVTAAGDYKSEFLIGVNSILEAKGWEMTDATLTPVLQRMDTMGIYGEVFGHQPGAFGITGRSAAKAGGRMIKIENGMAPDSGSLAGSLLVFTSPSEMNTPSYPHVMIVMPDGSSHALLPE